MGDTQYAYVHDPYLQLLSGYEHSLNYISVSTNHDIVVVNLPAIHDNDILSPKPNDNLNYLLNVNFADGFPFNKTKIFIETKVTAIKLQGFNL